MDHPPVQDGGEEQSHDRLDDPCRANLRVIVKRILRKYGYPQDKAGEGDADGIGATGSGSAVVMDSAPNTA